MPSRLWLLLLLLWLLLLLLLLLGWCFCREWQPGQSCQ